MRTLPEILDPDDLLSLGPEELGSLLLQQFNANPESRQVSLTGVITSYSALVREYLTPRPVSCHLSGDNGGVGLARA